MAGDRERNVVLIGMPGVGKSTLGVLLAKALNMDFVDTDVVVQSREGRRLQEIINERGMQAFCALEESHVLSLDCRSTVIATGGSVVYSEAAIRHLSKGGVIVQLTLPLPQLKDRLSDLGARGVVMAPGQTLDELYAERRPLYVRHADITVDCAGLTHDQVVQRVVAELR